MPSTIPNEPFSRSHSQSEGSDIDTGDGIRVPVLHLPGGGVALPGDVIDDGRICWSVDRRTGQVVYETTRRVFTPHPNSAVGCLRPADGPARPAVPGGPASGPVVGAGPDVTPGGDR